MESTREHAACSCAQAPCAHTAGKAVPAELSGLPHEDPRFEALCNEMRDALALAERRARDLRDRAARRAIDHLDPSHGARLAAEALDHAVLVIRAIEDGRMRVGKVMQYALQGGVSKYERTTEPAGDDGMPRLILDEERQRLDARWRELDNETSPESQLRRAIAAAEKAGHFVTSLTWTQLLGWSVVFG